MAITKRYAGIVLAAGAASRFGRPKQLLDYHGEPFVRAAARKALISGLDTVLVITGAYAAEVNRALQALPVRIIHNPDWQKGQSASLQTGLRALDETICAAIILLADQPQITPGVLQSLREAHQRSQYPIIAPLVEGRRANPVLLGAETFPLLMTLRGDTGARAIFQRHPPHYIPWLDEALLYDVDRPDDYARLMGLSNPN